MSARAVRPAGLTELITQVHADSRGPYGSLRVHAELTLGRGIRVGHNAVAMLMQRAGLAGVVGRPRFRHVPHEPTAGDHVKRHFHRDGPSQLWITDITEHRSREGRVFCAVVLDAFSALPRLCVPKPGREL
jgi:putative transposase